MDSSIIQGPVSVAPCQTLISRFATFPSQGEGRLSAAALQQALHRLGCPATAQEVHTLAAGLLGDGGGEGVRIAQLLDTLGVM